MHGGSGGDLMEAVLHSGWITELKDVIFSPREQSENNKYFE